MHRLGREDRNPRFDLENNRIILPIFCIIDSMALHFDKSVYRTRREQLIELLKQKGLSGVLLFRQESLYYLTGYDTFGYCFFQCLYLDCSGEYALLTRAPDRLQAQITSTITDIRIWVDEAGHNPASDLVSMLTDFGCQGQHLGIELHAYGLTAQVWSTISPTITRHCNLVDVSELVNQIRVIKSSSEMVYVQRAAELADDALDEAIRLSAPGVFDGEILAAMHAAIYRGGGDDPANEFILGSGQNALLCRYHSGRRHLSKQDQLTLEFAGVYRHYHAAMMRTIIVGQPKARQVAMHQACVEAILACQSVLKPGATVGDVFDIHARVMDAHGFQKMRMNACGYSLGATYAPTWMDWPMFYTGNTVQIEPNMIYFLHMILFDSDHAMAMTLGEPVRVTDSGCERLSRHNLNLIVA